MFAVQSHRVRLPGETGPELRHDRSEVIEPSNTCGEPTESGDNELGRDFGRSANMIQFGSFSK